MRVYDEEKELVTVVCNACGKDGESEKFDLCEACYEKLTAGFQVPVERRERKELL